MRHPPQAEWPDGRREALLFVLEAESDARRFSIHRLAHYCLDLAELMKTDRVVPVVIFLRRSDKARQRLCLGGDRNTYLDFRYLSCALGELSYEQHRDSDNLVVQLNLPNMAYPPGHKVEVYAQAVRSLTTLEPDPEKQLKYLDFIDIYAALEDNERAEYQRDYPEEAATMSPICRTLSRARFAARDAAGRGPYSGTATASEGGAIFLLFQNFRQERRTHNDSRIIR